MQQTSNNRARVKPIKEVGGKRQPAEYRMAAAVVVVDAERAVSAAGRRPEMTDALSD